MPIVPIPSLKAIQLESQAISSWKGTCDRLANISKPTLVIVGTDDGIVPPAYSLSLVQKIPGAWLVQIRRRSWIDVSISTPIYSSFRNLSFNNLMFPVFPYAYYPRKYASVVDFYYYTLQDCIAIE